MTTIQLQSTTSSNGTVLQGTSCNLTGNVYDITGSPITLASLSTLTMSLYDNVTAMTDPSSSIINSRDNVNIKNVSPGTVDSGGNYTIRLDALDNVIIGSTIVGQSEVHTVRLLWSWNDGVEVRTGGQEFTFKVMALVALS